MYDIITGNIFREYDYPFHDMRIVKKAKVFIFNILTSYIYISVLISIYIYIYILGEKYIQCLYLFWI